MKIPELNKLLNSELTSKIKESHIDNNEILINVEIENLHSTILFLKTDDRKVALLGILIVSAN